MMIAIINASPLIYLAKIGALKFLPKLFKTCITTNIVKKEVLGDIKAPEYIILEESFSDWLTIKNPTNENLVKKLEQMQLHLGEASIIALAKELYDQGLENIVLIDDLTARQIARTLNLKVTGTLGIIFKALSLKFINKTAAKEFLRILIEETSFRISVELYIDIINEIDKL